MVKTLKQPGLWLFSYSLTVVSCSSPLLPRPAFSLMVNLLSFGLELVPLTWQASAQLGHCAQSSQQCSHDTQNPGCCPWAALSEVPFRGCMWFVLLPVLWEGPVLCGLVGALITSSRRTVWVIFGSVTTLWLFLGHRNAWWGIEELYRDPWKLFLKR